MALAVLACQAAPDPATPSPSPAATTGTAATATPTVAPAPTPYVAPEAIEQEVTAAGGGKVAIAAGAEVQIPAGALSRDGQVSLATSLDHGTVDLSFALGEDGTFEGSPGLSGIVDAQAWSLVSDLATGEPPRFASGDSLVAPAASGWSAVGSLPNSVNALAPTDTALYAGTFGQATAEKVWKWSGDIWSALGSTSGCTGFNCSGDVYALAVSGADLYVGGVFSDLAGIPEADWIAKWNGVTWSALGSNGFGNGPLSNAGSSGGVYALAVSGSDLYAGGAFVNAAGIPEADYVAKWDGTAWSALGSDGAGNGALSSTVPMQVSALAVSGSDLYVAGGFVNAAGIAEADRIAKWDGTSWTALGSNGAGDGALTGNPSALLASGPDLYVAGGFVNAAGIAEADRIAKWDGTSWSALGSNGAGDGALQHEARALALAGNDLYVGGLFVNAAGIAEADRIAKWDGTSWTAPGSNGAGDGALNGVVRSLAIWGTGLYVGGGFTNAAGISGANFVARWDLGSEASALSCNPGSTSSQTPLAYGATVTCTFLPGAGATFVGYSAPHFGETSTGPDWATFIAEMGGPATIKANYTDSGGAKSIGVDYVVTITKPTLQLPFSASEGWYYSGGPHCDSYVDVGGTCPEDAARYAIDLVPPPGGRSCPGSSPSGQWARAAAAGTVRFRNDFTVQIDHGAGFGTGYYHLADIQVSNGQAITAGTPLGRPACLGVTSGVHLHFYTCYQPTSGHCPVNAKSETAMPISGTVLSGWTVGDAAGNYYGTLTKGTQVLIRDAAHGQPPIPLSISPDGSGTLTASVTTVSASQTGRTIAFTYTAATGGMSGGELRLIVPAGWSAPSTNSTAAGYTTANVGTLSVSSQAIIVSNVTRSAGHKVTVTYGSKAAGGSGATAPARAANQTWQAKQQSTTGSTLNNLAASPQIRIYAPDGSGTLTASVTTVSASQTGRTIAFTYTVAPGGIKNGVLRLTVPSGWSAPSLSGAAPGFVKASVGTVSISKRTIVVSGVSRSAGQKVTVTYGSKASGGPGAKAPSKTGLQTWPAKQKSTAGGTLTKLASQPQIRVHAADGSGTLATPTKAVSAAAKGRTITFTYTVAPGGMNKGQLRLTVPSGWSAPSLSGAAAGFVKASLGTVKIFGRTIVVSGVSRSAGQKVTITYGAKASGGPGAKAPSKTGLQTWAAKQKSTAGGTLTKLASQPQIRVK